ncbi:unnamed protein product [Peniophora sp. CBMAI 1063]|nr:unnamed protein product [Peniophora sp. CBMAI 1063]
MKDNTHMESERRESQHHRTGNPWKSDPTPITLPKERQSRLLMPSFEKLPGIEVISPLRVYPTRRTIDEKANGSDTRPAKRQRIGREGALTTLNSGSRRELPRSEPMDRLTESTPSSVQQRERQAPPRGSISIDIESDEDRIMVLPPLKRKDKGKTPMRVTTRTPQAGYRGTAIISPERAVAPVVHKEARPTLGSSRLPSESVKHILDGDSASITTHGSGGAVPLQDPVATQSQSTQTEPSHEISATPPLSIAAVKTLLDLRRSALEVLTEEQLPEELRVENLKSILGRTVAGVVASGSSGT